VFNGSIDDTQYQATAGHSVRKRSFLRIENTDRAEISMGLMKLSTF
jgi:hypothetical protein